MATLAGQRAQFTWAFNEYNKSDDPDTHAKFARRMAKYVAAAPSHGFTKEEITQGRTYPAEVDQYITDPTVADEPDVTEQQAILTINQAVDTSDVLRIGEGKGIVYGYGYRCRPDRVKVGSTEGDTIQRIAAQITTSTPRQTGLADRDEGSQLPCGRARHPGCPGNSGQKVRGGGDEWFTANRDEVSATYRFIVQRQ